LFSLFVCLDLLGFFGFRLAARLLIPLTSTTPQAIFNDLVEKSLYPLKLHLRLVLSIDLLQLILKMVIFKNN
jgi:hypothetical protein